MNITPRKVAFLQGIFYSTTAAWPIIDINSFMWVTGPKTDIWLVKTVSVLLLVMAVVFLLAAKRNAVSLEVMVLAVGAAAGLTLIDLYYSTTNTISDIYRFDALAELGLIALWAWAWNRKRQT